MQRCDRVLTAEEAQQRAQAREADVGRGGVTDDSDLESTSGEDEENQAESSSEGKSDNLSDISDKDDIFCVRCSASPPFHDTGRRRRENS